jgi:hypothetical protein
VADYHARISHQQRELLPRLLRYAALTIVLQPEFVISVECAARPRTTPATPVHIAGVPTTLPESRPLSRPICWRMGVRLTDKDAGTGLGFSPTRFQAVSGRRSPEPAEI